MKTEIVVYGVESKIACEYLETIDRLGYSLKAAILTDEPQWAVTLLGKKCTDRVAAALLRHPVAVAGLDPSRREEKARLAIDLGFASFPVLADPTATRARSSTFDDGVFLSSGSIIGAYTDVERFVLVSSNASVGHHCRVGAFTTVCQGANIGESSQIGPGCIVGFGATVLPESVVPAGSRIADGTLFGRR